MVETETVELTTSAVKQILKIRAAEQVPGDHYLRIGVKGGGCSGMSYILEFGAKSDMDVLIEQNGLEMVVDKRHLLYLGGTRLDFSEGLDNRGFVFTNPKATSTCGCGTSFSA
jgi:iron-sulfur cluster assembly protein